MGQTRSVQAPVEQEPIRHESIKISKKHNKYTFDGYMIGDKIDMTKPFYINYNSGNVIKHTILAINNNDDCETITEIYIGEITTMFLNKPKILKKIHHSLKNIKTFDPNFGRYTWTNTSIVFQNNSYFKGCVEFWFSDNEHCSNDIYFEMVEGTFGGQNGAMNGTFRDDIRLYAS